MVHSLSAWQLICSIFLLGSTLASRSPPEERPGRWKSVQRCLGGPCPGVSAAQVSHLYRRVRGGGQKTDKIFQAGGKVKDWARVTKDKVETTVRRKRKNEIATPASAPNPRNASIPALPAAQPKQALSRRDVIKFTALSAMMFGIIYVFTITRDMKDTLIVSYCGAEAIAFLKLWGVVPAAMAFLAGYSYAAMHLSKRALFYVTIIPFFVFYEVFAFVLYPNRHNLHLENWAPKSGDAMPFVSNLVRYWMFSAYYIVSELWGSAGVPLLFWQCANDVTPIDQAKRFYPLLAIFGNCAPVVAGQTTALVTKFIMRHHSDEHIAFERTLKILSTFMTVAGATVMGLYWLIMDLCRTQTEKATTTLKTKTTLVTSKTGIVKGPVVLKEKRKPSLIESFRILSKSTWLACIATMVVSYGLTMEFTEITWKAIAKLAYSNKQDYILFMGNYSTMLGVTTVCMLLLGSNFIKILGWKWGAMATPIIMATLAAPFFAYIGFRDVRSSEKALRTALITGTINNMLSKATKYAFFDPTKEVAYIPLDQEAKVKGKAAIDILGARLGKSGGALAQQLLVVFCGNIMQGAPLLATLFYLVIFGWIWSVRTLAHLFEEKERQSELETQHSPQ